MRLAVLGATGSIGMQALEVAAAHQDRFRVVAIGARRAAGLAEFAARFGARATSVEQDGEAGCLEIATADDVDLVVVGIPGIAALRPTLAALEAGKTVAIAAKEVLVVAGHLVRRHCGGVGERLRPIDGEHCALWQCLRGEERAAVSVVTITASGGAFRDLPLERLHEVTPERALAHPTWRMGPKITVDSATLVNKGFEVIEARWLFDLPYDRVRVAIHPQSIVHALVEFRDGSVKAQLARPDMRLFIQYALAAPDRLAALIRPLDIARGLELSFRAVDPARYPCFAIVLEAARQGPAATIAVNAADEVAVHRFLRGEIRFDDIARELERGLRLAEASRVGQEPTLDEILGLDAEVRAALRTPVSVV
jgi:1-deoxy-D-xylulose-5-phosphate reductoisomerase